jgi:four helix bundle protein
MFHEHGDLRDRTRDFALRIARAYRSLPARDRCAQIWGEQMLRAGGSIGANYREAQRGRSVAEFRSKLGDSLREAEETLYWIELLEAEKYYSPGKVGPLKDELDQLIAILVSLIRKGPAS